MLVAVCEDSQKDALRITEMLERYCAEKQLDFQARVFDSAEALLDAFDPGAFQIVFMDVLLGGQTGVEAVRKIRARDEDCAVIFITVSEGHAVEGFALRATHYLVKPVGYDMFCQAMDRCKEQTQRFARYIEVMVNREPVRIPARDIRYAEVFKNLCVIHMVNNDVKTYTAIDTLEEKLGGAPFLRCHRSYIVNLRRVTDLREDVFCLEGGGEVRISKTLLPGAKKAYRDFCAELADKQGAF